MKKAIILLISLLWLPQLLHANEGTIAFIGATLIDGTDAPPLANSTILITDGYIRAVGPSADVTVPANAQRIDVAGKYIIPGMINAHGHAGDTLGLSAGNYSRDNLLDHLGLYARYGITTVYSLGGDEAAGFALRNEQFTPDLDRARIFVAGTVVSGDDAASVRSQVNRNADMGADFIKTRVQSGGELPTIDRELFQTLVDQAHSRRLPVAVHIYYLGEAKMALQAGADLIAHSVRDRIVDDEFINLLRSNNVCYIPTLTREISTFSYEDVPEFFADPFFLKEEEPAIIAELSTPEYQSRIRNSGSAQQFKADLPNALANVGMLHRSGVKIAMGTDSGPPARFQGYFEHMEMQMMANADMSPLDVIRSATGVAAGCMGAGDIGTIEPGNWGDLVVLAANPAEDIGNTRSIESVWIAGNRVPD
ncbi:MAG: amidohydrolase family protein [Gammaproteobacteria bacterium]